MAGGERVVAAGSVTLAGARLIASPIQHYFDGTDHLRLEGWNARAGFGMRITGRFVDDVEGLKTFEQTLALTDTRTRCVVDIPIGKGYLTNVVVVAYVTAALGDIVAPPVFTTFARVTVIRGYSGGTMTIGTLLQGYVTASVGIAWPGSPITHSADGVGYVRTIDGTQPPPGGDITETVPLAARWRLLHLLVSFTTSAVVGNRTGILRIKDVSFADRLLLANVTSQPPSTTWQYNWAPGFPMSSGGAGLYLTTPLPPDLFLRSTEGFTTSTLGFSAGDQWGVPRYTVMEWLEIG